MLDKCCGVCWIFNTFAFGVCAYDHLCDLQGNGGKLPKHVKTMQTVPKSRLKAKAPRLVTTKKAQMENIATSQGEYLH